MSAARRLLVRTMLLIVPQQFAAAQLATSNASLSGIVRNSGTGLPIAAVVVEVDSALRQETDPDGRFSFAQIQPGSHQISLHRLGYEPLNVTLVLEPETNIRQEFALRPIPAVLQKVVIRGKEVVVPGSLQEAYKRAADGKGAYFFKEDIDLLQPSDVKSLFARLPGVRVTDTDVYFQKCQSLLIGSIFGADKTSPKVQVWVDGVKVSAVSYAEGPGETVATILRTIPPSAVQLIEVYTGVARLPAEFLDDACAVIVIWTKRF